MQRCSYFLKNKALFGSFPSQEEVNYLESEGVRVFLDLTEINEEKTIPYRTKYKYIKYPIPDHYQPTNWRSFSELIVYISNTISNLEKHEKIYCHCKGGHGRSGMLVAAFLCYKFNLSSEEGLMMTRYYHSLRPEMRDKWRKIGSPQGKKQKDFIRKFFRPLRYYQEDDKERFTDCFCDESHHSITISLGTFPNAYCAIKAYRDPENTEYIEALQNGYYDEELLSDKASRTDSISSIYKVLYAKVQQHLEISEKLMKTGLRPLINEAGLENHSKILTMIRSELLYDSILEKMHSGNLFQVE